jgi:hypothetical protein
LPSRATAPQIPRLHPPVPPLPCRRTTSTA